MRKRKGMKAMVAIPKMITQPMTESYRPGRRKRLLGHVGRRMATGKAC